MSFMVIICRNIKKKCEIVHCCSIIIAIIVCQREILIPLRLIDFQTFTGACVCILAHYFQ